MVSDPLVQQRFWAKVAKSDGCWEWTAYRNRTGYGVVRIYGQFHTAHRVAYEWANGPIPAGRNVCHHCDNRACVRPDHLFAGTHRDNSQDALRKGRLVNNLAGLDQKGEANPGSKLTNAFVLEIRRLYASGVRQSEIADRMGLTRPAVHYVVRRKTWSHVP